MTFQFCHKENLFYEIILNKFYFLFLTFLSHQMLKENFEHFFHIFASSLEQTELLDYYARYGSFGFIIDLAINKYFILEDKVVIRDVFYINNKENIDFINIDEYLKYFFLLIYITVYKGDKM